jgi:hypothetical protein
MSEVVPSDFTEIALDMLLKDVKAEPLAPWEPAPQAIITAPELVGVIAGGLGREALPAWAVVVVTSRGLDVSTPRHT